MPTPESGESRDDFVSRCIPVVIEDGTAENPDQAVAVCNSMWEEAQEGKDMTKNMEHKTFPGMVVKADEEQGIVDAFFAIFGNVDEGQDVMHPGAFTKTFSERGNKVRVLDNHRTDSIMRAIGKPIMLKEVGRDELPGDLLLQHPDATGGAFASIQMLMDTAEGRGAFIRLRDKAITEWSFGYDPVDFDFETRQDNGREVNVRNLRTVKLYEISPVLFAMNEATTTVGAKDVSGEMSGDDPDELKIGRAISAANMAKIQNVIDGIQSQLVQLERMLTGAQQVPDDEEEQPDKAGPDSAPPPTRPDDVPPTDETSKRLRELELLENKIALLEVDL